MLSYIKKMIHRRYRLSLTIAHFLFGSLIMFADEICAMINKSQTFVVVYFIVIISLGFTLNIYTLKNRWRLVPPEGTRDRLINQYTAVIIAFGELFALLLTPVFFEL